MNALWLLAVILALIVLAVVYVVLTHPGGARGWYRDLPDQWKATLRSAWQYLVGIVGTLALGSLAIATGLLNGGTLEQAITDASVALKAAGVAVLTLAGSIVTFWMNRGNKGAHYSPPDPPPHFGP